MESSRFLAILNGKDNAEEGYGILNFVVVRKHARRSIAHRRVSVAAVAGRKSKANQATGAKDRRTVRPQTPFLQTPMFQRLDMYDAISCYEHSWYVSERLHIGSNTLH